MSHRTEWHYYTVSLIGTQSSIVKSIESTEIAGLKTVRSNCYRKFNLFILGLMNIISSLSLQMLHIPLRPFKLQREPHLARYFDMLIELSWYHVVQTLLPVPPFFGSVIEKFKVITGDDCFPALFPLYYILLLTSPSSASECCEVRFGSWVPWDAVAPDTPVDLLLTLDPWKTLQRAAAGIDGRGRVNRCSIACSSD